MWPFQFCCKHISLTEGNDWCVCWYQCQYSTQGPRPLYCKPTWDSRRGPTYLNSYWWSWDSNHVSNMCRARWQLFVLNMLHACLQKWRVIWRDACAVNGWADNAKSAVSIIIICCEEHVPRLTMDHKHSLAHIPYPLSIAAWKFPWQVW